MDANADCPHPREALAFSGGRMKLSLDPFPLYQPAPFPSRVPDFLSGHSSPAHIPIRHTLGLNSSIALGSTALGCTTQG